MAKATTGKAVGLEIDYGTIRAVEASGTPANPKIAGIASVRLPEGSIEEGIVVKPHEVGLALRELWGQGKVKNRRVLLGISNQSVLVRYTTIPKVPKEKMANVVRFQAQELLPVPIEQVVLDFMVIGETIADENPALEILLVAARRDMLRGFLEALSAAKLEPADIDVSTLALMRVLPKAANDRTVAVINVAEGLTNILVSDKGRPRLARLVAVRLNDLAVKLDVPLANLFITTGNLNKEQRQIYDEWVETLINEVSSSLSYYQNLSGATSLEAVILNGKGALLPGIYKRLEDALGLSVKVINPFDRYINGTRLKAGSDIGLVEYAICAGLALRALEGS